MPSGMLEAFFAIVLVPAGMVVIVAVFSSRSNPASDLRRPLVVLRQILRL